ncbi:hypothetical protein C0213_08215 [Latilactobacillus sakei]|nr:HTH domain-containing protein [Latilactobacillus sakei]AUX12403.1 hypothetical protein C0213_08215 [Latilactobacillus sakei]
MLNERQIVLLQYLMKNSYSGGELATYLKTSRRTVIRDVALIDYWLTTNQLGTIDNSQRYSLTINDQTELQKKLQVLQLQKYRLLALVLINRYVTIDDLTDQMWLTKKEIDDEIKALNRNYQYLFVIEKKTSKGIYITASNYERINLLASLLFSFTDLMADLPDGMSEKATVKANQMTSSILNFETKQQLAVQLIAYQLCQNAIPTITFSDYLAQKLAKIQKISDFNLGRVLARMNEEYQVQIDTEVCATILVQHIQRTLSFPSYFESDMRAQFEELRLIYPFIFEFAQVITDNIQAFLDVLFIDSQYIALYMTNSQTASEAKINLVMYEERYSISNINQVLIENKMNRVNLEIAHSVDKLEELLEQHPNSILIIDRNQVLKNHAAQIDYVFNGILNDDDLLTIQDVINTTLIKKEIETVLTPTQFMSLSSQPTFKETLAAGLVQLTDDGRLTKQQAVALENRELAGNQLVVGQLSLPHIKAPIETPFKLFYFKLSEPVKIEETSITAIMIVIVDSRSTEYTQLFSYLYAKFKTLDLTRINNYETLLANVINR